MNKGIIPPSQPRNPLNSGVTTPQYGPGIVPSSSLAPVVTQPATPMTKVQKPMGFGDYMHSIGSGIDSLDRTVATGLTGKILYDNLGNPLNSSVLRRFMPRAFGDLGEAGLGTLAEEMGIEMIPMAAALL